MNNENFTITTIKASSRVSVCIDKNYYTVEYTEERALKDSDTLDVELEREKLWDTVNGEVDNQIEDIHRMFAK